MNIKLGKNQFVTIGLLFLLLGFAWPAISGTTPQFIYPQHLRSIELGTWTIPAWTPSTGTWINYTITIPQHSGSLTIYPPSPTISPPVGTGCEVYVNGVFRAKSLYNPRVWLHSFTLDLPAGDYVLAVHGYTRDNPLTITFRLGYDPPPYEKTVLLKSFDAVSHPADPVGEPFTAYWSSGDFQITIPDYQTRCGYIRVESLSSAGLHRHVWMSVDGHSIGSIVVSPNDENVYLFYDDPLAGTHMMSLSFCLTPPTEGNAPYEVPVVAGNWTGTVNVFFHYMPTTAPPAPIPVPPIDNGTIPPPTPPVPAIPPYVPPTVEPTMGYLQWILYAIGAVMLLLGFRRK